MGRGAQGTNAWLETLTNQTGGKEALKNVLREYFMVCHRMSDFILLIYQETRSLPDQWQTRVLENELRITNLFVDVLDGFVKSGDLPPLDRQEIDLAAHNISVLGHMWTFRRWYFGRHYSIEDYIRLQTGFILNMCSGSQKDADP